MVDPSQMGGPGGPPQAGPPTPGAMGGGPPGADPSLLMGLMKSARRVRRTTHKGKRAKHGGRKRGK